MKNLLVLSAFLLVAGVAQAGDVKILPGIACYSVGGTPQVSSDGSILTNVSATTTMQVFCPVVRDVTTTTTGLLGLKIAELNHPFTSTYNGMTGKSAMTIRATSTDQSGTVLKQVSTNLNPSTQTGEQVVDFAANLNV